MTIDYTNFTPIPSLVGGLMIGFGALILMGGVKSIMGVSGIARQAMTGPDRLWRTFFLAGIVVAAAFYLFTVNPSFTPIVTSDTVMLMTGGLIVGMGTSIGNGCTSGHGVCGLSRLSARSLASVLIFMASAMITYFLVK